MLCVSSPIALHSSTCISTYIILHMMVHNHLYRIFKGIFIFPSIVTIEHPYSLLFQQFTLVFSKEMEHILLKLLFHRDNQTLQYGVNHATMILLKYSKYTSFLTTYLIKKYIIILSMYIYVFVCLCALLAPFTSLINIYLVLILVFIPINLITDPIHALKNIKT